AVSAEPRRSKSRQTILRSRTRAPKLTRHRRGRDKKPLTVLARTIAKCRQRSSPKHCKHAREGGNFSCYAPAPGAWQHTTRPRAKEAEAFPKSVFAGSIVDPTSEANLHRSSPGFALQIDAAASNRGAEARTAALPASVSTSAPTR